MAPCYAADDPNVSQQRGGVDLSAHAAEQGRPIARGEDILP